MESGGLLILNILLLLIVPFNHMVWKINSDFGKVLEFLLKPNIAALECILKFNSV